MSVKASVSIQEQQDSFARKLVEDGRFSSLSAVVQRGLELVRHETELQDAELAALKNLLDERSKGEFVSLEEGRKRTEKMIAAKKAAYGL
jgi:antitoxin ParD1/3/4